MSTTLTAVAVRELHLPRIYDSWQPNVSLVAVMPGEEVAIEVHDDGLLMAVYTDGATYRYCTPVDRADVEPA